MFVRYSMTASVITVTSEDSLEKARNLMKTNRIRHLPVVDEINRVLGIVTDRDIRLAAPSLLEISCEPGSERKRIAQMPVEAIMTKDPVTIRPEDTLQDALILISIYA